MPGCAVFGSKNYLRKTKRTNIKYFGFPKTDIAKAWVNGWGWKDTINLKNACICSIHFSKDSFEIPLQQRLLNYSTKTGRNLKQTAVPTENLPLKKRQLSAESEDRLRRQAKRYRQTFIESFVNISGHSRQLSTADQDKENQSLETDTQNILVSSELETENY